MFKPEAEKVLKNSMSDTQQALRQFVANVLDVQLPQCELKPLLGDAGFRQYFRVYLSDGSTYMAAFVPPATEKNAEFIAIATSLHQAQVLAPQVLAFDMDNGFLLQQDLGDITLLKQLTSQNVDGYYLQCMQQVQKMQQVDTDALALPLYDAALLQQELDLFTDWFVEKLLGYSLDADEKAICEKCFAWLIEQALEQPQVFVHRDYHSRNILLLDDEPATIDFQDAVVGPITYDLVSLLRDCYIAWPQEKVMQWVEQFYQQCLPASAHGAISLACFKQWFDAMGLQRHIKVLGIFARLSLRDHKHRYLDDLPQVLNYVLEVAQAYPEGKAFYQLVSERLLPLCKQQSWGKNV